MTTVNTLQARMRFSDLLNRVAQGKKIVITRHGIPAALLVPVEETSAKMTHQEIVEGMRAVRKRIKRGNMSLREMVAERRRL